MEEKWTDGRLEETQKQKNLLFVYRISDFRPHRFQWLNNIKKEKTLTLSVTEWLQEKNKTHHIHEITFLVCLFCFFVFVFNCQSKKKKSTSNERAFAPLFSGRRQVRGVSQRVAPPPHRTPGGRRLPGLLWARPADSAEAVPTDEATNPRHPSSPGRLRLRSGQPCCSASARRLLRVREHFFIDMLRLARPPGAAQAPLTATSAICRRSYFSSQIKKQPLLLPVRPLALNGLFVQLPWLYSAVFSFYSFLCAFSPQNRWCRWSCWQTSLKASYAHHVNTLQFYCHFCYCVIETLLLKIIHFRCRTIFAVKSSPQANVRIHLPISK